MFNRQRVVAIIPAMNEEKAIGQIVRELLELGDTDNQKWIDQVIVCDNASTDNTKCEAESAGAVVVYEAVAGYGKACLTAISKIEHCDIVLFVDGDRSVYTHQAQALLEAVSSDFDMAIGSRTKGNIEVAALTPPQRFGNWLAIRLINLLWGYRYSDLGPFRAIRYDALLNLDMQDERFGWTVEMQIKALQNKLTICERPVDSRARLGKSKISGTVKGVIGAGIGIIGTIFLLRFSASKIQRHQNYRGNI